MLQRILKIGGISVLGLVMHHPNPFVIKTSDYSKGVVRRAIVRNDYLIIGLQLRNDRHQLFFNVFLTIVGGKTYRDFHI